VRDPWWRRGFFDAAMARVLFDDEKEAEAPLEVRGLLKLTGLRRGAVLDAACGTGRHSAAFAAKGFKVTGVDVNALYLRQARRRLRSRGLKARFLSGELSRLGAFAGGFDLVVNLFTSFGYLSSAAENEASLRQMAACLKPGGSLAVELLPRESLRRFFQPRAMQSVPGGWLIQERRWRPGGKRVATRAIWESGGRRRAFDSEFQTYSRAELLALFKRAGLRGLRAYGGFDGSPFRAGGRLLVLGREA
jgi:SAM-dependent methyltransferase